MPAGAATVQPRRRQAWQNALANWQQSVSAGTRGIRPHLHLDLDPARGFGVVLASGFGLGLGLAFEAGSVLGTGSLTGWHELWH